MLLAALLISPLIVAKREVAEAANTLEIDDQVEDEEDLIYRLSDPSLIHAAEMMMPRSADSGISQGPKLDIFYAFDSAPHNHARRKYVRKWLADLQTVASNSDITIAHRFFSAALVRDVRPAEVVIQPEKNHVQPEEDPISHWSQRWLFDLHWALEHYDFDKIVRADDDGFQCPAGMLNLLQHLPQDRPLMVFSSDKVANTKPLSSKELALHQWPVTHGSNLVDFEENWMLLDRSMASSIYELQKKKGPGDNQNLPEYIRSVFDPPHWPPSDSMILDTGRFDDDHQVEHYPACNDTLSEACRWGFNMWDTGFHGLCLSFQDCAAECRNRGLLWLHHVANFDV